MVSLSAWRSNLLSILVLMPEEDLGVRRDLGIGVREELACEGLPRFLS